jgi:hypothetical protein
MKITVNQLKQIVNEELSKLKEDISGEIPSSERMQLTNLIHSAVELCDAVDDKKYKACQKHLLAAHAALKGGPRI